MTDPPKPKRRRFLRIAAWTAGAGLLGIAGVRMALPRWSRPGPVEPLPGDLQAFVEECFRGLDRDRIWDGHVHLLGLGAGGTGAWVRPEMRNPLHPVLHLQYELFAAAAGMQDAERADADYLRRLLRLHRQANPRGTLVLLAFERFHDDAGEPVPERSTFYTPDDYVLRVAEREPDCVAAVSIHPYRPDAVDRLERAAARGAVAVKWLPAAMNIDPASARCDAFYDALARLDLPLISHGGAELAAEAGAGQDLGNPLRLRRALERGARVAVAHCASLGSMEDLDASGRDRPRIASWRLFLRLMDEPAWTGRLFGDLSAVTQWNRPIAVLRALLGRPDLHPRLLHASDYPVPALRLLFSTEKLRWEGLLADGDVAPLDRLAERNPLLFDFCLKRRLRETTPDGPRRFAAAAFHTRAFFR